MANTNQQASQDPLLEAARKKVWAEFAKLDHQDKAKRVVLETKQRLKALNCGHLSVRRGRGTAYGRLNIQHRDPGKVLQPREMLVIAEVLNMDPRSRTNSISMWFIEAEMRLGLRPKQPLCTWCGCTYKTEREALECLKSH